jgi:Fe-S cluster assembly scaffold protein SufB
MKLNETPVRTSRNFNINNIKLEDVIIPAEIKEFNNVQIIAKSKKDIISKEASKNFNLIYGLNDEIEEQVKNQANHQYKIEVNSKMDNDIVLTFKFDDDNLELVDNIEIIAKECTKSTIIIKYEGVTQNPCYHNGIIRVKAKKNAEINLVVVNLLNTKSTNFLSLENSFEYHSKISYTMVEFGAKNNIVNYYSNITGDEAENTISAMYLGKEEQLIDLNYIAELRGEKSNVKIEVQGALKDMARKHFKGTIDFKKGAKKAIGDENENCMLLSNTAKSLALPMLLCSEEDVEGNHSTSSGKVGDKELFYIMSRGFSKNEAMKLLVRAKFNKILENIPNDEIKNQI